MQFKSRKEEVMPKKKKKELTAFQKRAKANLEANKKGYVTGPKGGAQTAVRIGRKPPKTSGPGFFGRGKKAEAASNKKAGYDFRKPVKPGGKKSHAQKGVEAIMERKNQGTKAGSRALGKEKAATERAKAKKAGQKKQK
jgi:hypothetical protein